MITGVTHTPAGPWRMTDHEGSATGQAWQDPPQADPVEYRVRFHLGHGSTVATFFEVKRRDKITWERRVATSTLPVTRRDAAVEGTPAFLAMACYALSVALVP